MCLFKLWAKWSLIPFHIFWVGNILCRMASGLNVLELVGGMKVGQPFDLVLVLTSTFIGACCLESIYWEHKHSPMWDIALIINVSGYSHRSKILLILIKSKYIYKTMVGLPMLLVWFSTNALEFLSWYLTRLLSFLYILWLISWDGSKGFCCSQYLFFKP